MIEEEIIEPCLGCGRRSSQMWGKYCRNCTAYKPDHAEKEAFLALCERQKLKMTNPDIYLRRRKNALKLAAISWKKKSENKGKIKSAYGKFNLIERSEERLEHFILIDEIWNYLNPTRRLASDWGKGLEVVWAVDALKSGNFDELYDAEIAKSGFKKEKKIMKKLKKYDSDFYAWTIQQASLLRAKRFDEVDFKNVAEEIESVGKQIRGWLYDAVTLLQATALIHWAGNATELSFKTMEQVRSRAIDLLEEYPGLFREIDKIIEEGWSSAISIAAASHDEIKFPANCPWTATEMLTEYWLPKVKEEFKK